MLAGLLAERLLAHAPAFERVYLGNSGTEAVEGALKFARCATGRAASRLLRPRLPRAHDRLAVGQRRQGVPQGLRSAAARRGGAVRRPRRARGRAAPRRRGRLRHRADPGQDRARAAARLPGRARTTLLHQHGALLIADEVQTGVGRTGRFFAYEHDGVTPDIVTVAKTLSGGFVPVGAILAKGWIFDKVYSTMDRALVHDSTFGGNALAATAGLATLSVIDDEGLVANAERVGARAAGRAGGAGRPLRDARRRARAAA